MIYPVLILTTLLQGTLFSIPFIIPIILLYFIFSKNEASFFIALVFGIVIDLLLLNPIGLTSIFLIILLFISTLYTRIFEMENFYFAAVFTLAGSAIYSYIFYPTDFILKALVCFLIASITFLVINTFKKRTQDKNLKRLLK